MIRSPQLRHYIAGELLLLSGAYRRLSGLMSISRIKMVGILLLLLLPSAVLVPQMAAQSDFQITSASPSFIAAGANGATLVLGGSLSGLADGGFQVCFYNGFASSAPITPIFANNAISLLVPASTIQGVAPSKFTAANSYSVPGQVYVASSGSTTCDGTFDTALTNSLVVPIAEPLLGASTSPTQVPQTNSVTGQQAPPFNLVLSGSSFTSGTVVTLGSFGVLPAKILSPSALSISVPAAFSSSAVGTTASVTVCGGTSYCSGAASTVTLVVSALVPSLGTLTIAPTPTTTQGTTTLNAQFKRDPQNGTALPEPGAPSGVVTFNANGAAVGTAALTLDTTAVFVPIATTTQIPAAATPLITPAAGTYLGAQTITIADSTPGAAIFYTTDGTTPTAASTPYTAPFSIAASETISAIAIVAGYRPSAVATQAYVIRNLTPVGLAFLTQPSTTATGVAIAPPVTVAVIDVDGDTVSNSSLPVTIGLGANPGQGTLAGTLTVNAVNGIATFPDLSILPIANAYTLVATSGQLTPATSAAFNVTPYPISVTLFAPLIGVTSTLPGSFTLSHPAPTGGVVVSLASSDTTLVTVSPATVTVAAGQTTGSFTYTGVQPTSTAPPANNNLGVATITASAPNYLAGSASTTETYSLVSLGTIPPIAPAQVLDLATSLATNAPAGGVTIYFTSTDPTVATITSSVFVPQGQRTASANPQITGVKIGTTNIVATAQGYAPDYRTVNVTVTASFSPANIYIPLATSNVPTLNIAAPAQTGGIKFNLSSDNTASVTVPASVTIPAGQTSVVVPVTGVADSPNQAYVTIRATSPGVTEADLGVYVTSNLNVGNATTGVNMQTSSYVTLPSTSPTPVTVTVTSNDPTVALLSKSTTAVGSASLTFPNITSNNVPGFYVQGQSAGTTTISASAPGYTTSTGNYLGTVTVQHSGFIFDPYNSNPFNTTTLSSATNYTINPVLLDGNNNFSSFGTLSPGIAPVTITVTSSNTAVGTIQSPIVFHAGDQGQSASFQPVGAGTTTLSLGTTPPTGYTLPGNYQTSVANVSAPQLSVSNTIGGVNFQSQMSVYLQSSPPNPVSVTLTSSNPAIVLLSADGTTAGSGSITVPNVTGSFSFYVQGKSVGTATITATANGYASATGTNAGTFTCYPSGFTINPYDGSTYSTTTFSSPDTGYEIVPAILYPTGSSNAGNFYTFGTLSPGAASVTVPLSSSSTSVGTVTPSSLTFAAGDSGHNFTFTPAGAGTTNFGISGTPVGYTTGTNNQTVAATVTAPQLNIGNDITGVNIQNSATVTLSAAPPNPVTVTITSSNPGIALLSTSATTVGTNNLTVNNVTGGFSIYIQGKAVGTTILTATAPGYSSATGMYAGTITVYPSGFIFYYGVPINTSTFSPPTQFPVYPSILYPSSASNAGSPYQVVNTLSPGVGPVVVPITSSDTVVGTVATTALTFNAGDTSQQTTFQPTSAGTTTIAIGTPTGYTTPATGYNTFVATVTAPAIGMNNVTTGYGLESTTYVSLPVAPPNPVTVTVTSNGPAIATISKDGTVVGGTSLTFTNVTSSGNLPVIYVQGQPSATGVASSSSVATTLTASAPGYTNAVATVTVDPSGFATYYDQSFTRTVANGPDNISVYSWILNPGTLTLQTYGLGVNPGITADVSVTSSDTTVGTISNTPIPFTSTSGSGPFTFTPVGTGTATITIGNPNPAIFSNPSEGQSLTATVQ